LGYNTDYAGKIEVVPPFDEDTVRRLKQEHDEFDSRIVTVGRVQVKGYCQWEVTPDGTGFVYDGEEKFYDGPEWMRYLIETEVIPTGRVANGSMMAQGEETGDVWRLIVENNQVFTQHFDFQRKVEQIELERKPV
jgi:hypothetical protein